MRIEAAIDISVLRDIEKRTPRLFRDAIAQTGMAVEAEAVKQLQVGPNRAEATGNLIGSMTTFVRREGDHDVAIVGNTAKYAQYVHRGTGIYGPSRKPITPKKGKALRFEIGGVVLFRRSVKGMRSRPFLRDAVREVVPGKMGEIFMRVVGRSIFAKPTKTASFTPLKMRDKYSRK